eukprot:TRINITY_DN543_c2_g2_i5.p1 TRINITY_DN543_c2_g2~~TRINITY_DN543_c2_g2_i5.p1  ORF type:complete len:164 (+),score=43.19 TRINITY_DN543_c2_g2_i5:117-608(+)
MTMEGQKLTDENTAELGIFSNQYDWGERGGKCSDICDCQPCCSGYCCITWMCCGQCNFCKLYSWSMDQPCAVVNHCLPVVFCGLCAQASTRWSVRRKAGMMGGGPKEGLVGDCLMVCCCGSCSFCQVLRASHTIGGQESWDFFGNMAVSVTAESGFKMPPFMV